MSQVTEAASQVQQSGAVLGGRIARVNLLPPEIETARRLRRTQAGLGVGLVVVAACLGGVYAMQVHAKNQAAEDLAVQKAETVRLQKEQAKYADIPRTMAAIDAAETARSTAMANDVEWFRQLNNFSLTIPSNVWLTNLTMGLAPTTAAATTATTATTTTAPAATPAPVNVGTLSVQGVALNHPDVATWLDVLARQPGMSDAYFSNATKAKIGKKDVVDFTSTAIVTSDALSHRYDGKEG
jgi:Tfp pilus assembly protein PilN